MTTTSELSTKYNVELYDHVMDGFGDVEVPVITGPQSQGDVRIRPLDTTPAVTVKKNAKWVPVGLGGIDVVKPVSGHTHTLVASSGVVTWTTDVTDTTGLAIGVAKVSDVAWLAHAEHGFTGIGAGTYTLRRQREQADVQRIVAD